MYQIHHGVMNSCKALNTVVDSIIGKRCRLYPKIVSNTPVITINLEHVSSLVDLIQMGRLCKSFKHNSISRFVGGVALGA